MTTEAVLVAVGAAVLAMLSGVSIVLAAAIVGGRARDRNLAAGVFPPWWRRARVERAAAGCGQVVATGSLPFVVLVLNQREDVSERMRRSGALFSLDARLVPLSRG